MRRFSLGMATKCHPTTNNDEQDDNQLDNTKRILKKDTPFQGNGVDKKGGSETGQTNSTLIPSSDLNICCVEDILTEDNTVTCCPSE
jgi:hypothetical protein